MELKKTFQVILVEDNPGDSALFQSYLNKISITTCDLLTAETFSDAIKYLSEKSFDIIFTKLNLPDSKGLATLNNLLHLKHACPIVVITADDEHDTGLKALQLGAEDYLSKAELNSFNLEKSIIYSIERNKLSRQLFDSESRFRRMFEYSSIGIFRSTSGGSLIEVNKAYAKIFGYRDPKEVLDKVTDIGQQLYKNPTIRNEIMNDFKTQKTEFKQIEVDFYKKDGSVFNGLLNMRRSDETTSDDFVVEGYVQDITDKKIADQKIIESLQFLKDVMDNIPSPVFTKDINLKFTGCNKEFERYFGYKETDILGKRILEIKSDEFSEHSHHMDMELLETKKKQVFERQVDYPNGEKHDVIFHKNVIMGQSGDVIGIIGLIQDITDKKQALEQLREELWLNEAMTELSKQLLKPGISIPEISTLILEFAKKLTKSEHGYAGTIDQENDDLLLHTFTEMVKDDCNIKNQKPRFPKLADGYPQLWGNALNTLQAFYTNSPQSHQKSGGTPKGHIPLNNFLSVPAIVNRKLVGQIALANSAKQFDDDDLEYVKKLTNLFSLAIEKQNSVEEIICAREKAELSDKLKSAFLANMSHEIRTPLNAIVGFAQMLGEEGIGEEETREFKGVIIKNTDILLRLISDIIEMAMIEAGELKIHPENRPVVETLNQIYQIWKMNDEACENEGKIKFKLDITNKEEAKKIFKIDALRFSQIIDNLLLNAFRFTSEGEITIGNHYIDNQYVIIFVKDTGVGISKEDQMTIFDRFRQVDELKVRPFSGTGLGLAITKKLVEHLSGEIWVESELGAGSTFYMKFPLHAGKVSKQTTITKGDNSPTQANKQKNIEGNKILIVEDNDASFDFLEIVLRRKGAKVKRAINGKEAVEKAGKEDFDIVLMDLQLPEMSGFDAIKNIRLTKNTVPIIVQTAFSEQNEREKAFDAGCNHYLVKPITKNKLEDAVLKFC